MLKEITIKKGTYLIEYSKVMENQTVNLDGDICPAGRKLVERKNIKVIVNNETIESDWIRPVSAYRPAKNGGTHYIGCVELSKEISDILLAEIAKIMIAGTSAEAQAIETEKENKKADKETAEAERILEKAGKQTKVKTPEEAKVWKTNYINLQNEGDKYGFVPEIITTEDVKWAKGILNQ